MPYFFRLCSAIVLSLSACQFSYSTAELSNLKVCSALGEDNSCTTHESLFMNTTPQFVASCDLDYAPEGSSVVFYWYALENGPYLIDSVVFVSESGSSLDIHSTLHAPHKGWPVGEYEVRVRLMTDNGNSLSRKFSVGQERSEKTADPSPVPANTVRERSSQDEHALQTAWGPLGLCEIDQDRNTCSGISVFSPTERGFKAACNVSGSLQGHSAIFSWYVYGFEDKRQLIDRAEVPLQDAQQILAESKLSRSDEAWPESLYEVEISLSNEAIPAQSRFFYVDGQGIPNTELEVLDMYRAVRGFFQWYRFHEPGLNEVPLVRYADLSVRHDMGGLDTAMFEYYLDLWSTCPYIHPDFIYYERKFFLRLQDIWRAEGELMNGEDEIIPEGLHYDRVLATQEMDEMFDRVLTQGMGLTLQQDDLAWIKIAGMELELFRDGGTWRVRSLPYHD